jgi:hypothetical protein
VRVASARRKDFEVCQSAAEYENRPNEPPSITRHHTREKKLISRLLERELREQKARLAQAITNSQAGGD